MGVIIFHQNWRRTNLLRISHVILFTVVCFVKPTLNFLLGFRWNARTKFGKVTDRPTAENSWQSYLRPNQWFFQRYWTESLSFIPILPMFSRAFCLFAELTVFWEVCCKHLYATYLTTVCSITRNRSVSMQ